MAIPFINAAYTMAKFEQEHGREFFPAKEGPFEVHIYTQGRYRAKLYNFHSFVLAQEFAKLMFEQPTIYKVKVWDLARGPVQLNNPNAPGLVLELV